MQLETTIVFFPTTDLAATAAFYEQTLGLALTVDQGNCRIYRAGAGYVGFCQAETAPQHDGLILTLVSDDVDGWYARLHAAGVPTDGAPRANPRYRIYHFFARDPNGYRLEVQRFLHKDWR